MRYAVILNGVVVNIVLWDGVTEWNPGDEYTVIDSETLQIGDPWDAD